MTDIKLTTFGQTFFLVRPQDAFILPVFVNLDNELRRRLDATFADSKKLFDLAIKRKWIIIEVIRLTGDWGDMSQQKYKIKIYFNNDTFLSKDKNFFAATNFIAYLQKYLKQVNLAIKIKVFKFDGDKIVVENIHHSQNADFARLFIEPYRDNQVSLSWVK